MVSTYNVDSTQSDSGPHRDFFWDLGILSMYVGTSTLYENSNLYFLRL